MNTARRAMRTFAVGGAGCLLFFGLFVLLVVICGGRFNDVWSGALWVFVLGGVGALGAAATYRAIRRDDAEASIQPPGLLAEATFWRFIFGDGERDVPIRARLFPDRLILDWGILWWKTRVEIPWKELTIVPAATVGLNKQGTVPFGNHANWDQYGMALRWDTAGEPHRGWKRLWLPCAPGDTFYSEVRRLIETFHSAMESGFEPPQPPNSGWIRPN